MFSCEGPFCYLALWHGSCLHCRLPAKSKILHEDVNIQASQNQRMPHTPKFPWYIAKKWNVDANLVIIYAELCLSNSSLSGVLFSVFCFLKNYLHSAGSGLGQHSSCCEGRSRGNLENFKVKPQLANVIGQPKIIWVTGYNWLSVLKNLTYH